MRMQQLPRQFLSHLFGIGRLGHCTDDTFALNLLHRRLPQVRMYEVGVYEGYGLPRMLLG
jgi:hypothetical protein